MHVCMTCVHKMFHFQVNKNDTVIVEGDDGDNFYVVDR